MRIKAKLTLCFLFIAVFSVILIIIPITVSQSRSVNRSITKTATLQIDNVYKEVENFLQKPFDIIDSVDNFISTEKDETKETIEDFFIKAKTEDPMYSMLYFMNEIPIPEGGTVYADNHWMPPEGWNQFTRSWFTVCMDNEGYNITEPYIDDNTGDLVVTIAKDITKTKYSKALSLLMS